MALARSDILGGWELVSFTARDIGTGRISHPLGRRPSGLIIYTDDGYMSAQLTRERAGENPRRSAESSTDPDYVAYGGRFDVDEASATIRHDVMISMLPALLAQPQLRHATLAADRLTLSARATDPTGAATHSTLIWRRAASGARG